MVLYLDNICVFNAYIKVFKVFDKILFLIILNFQSLFYLNWVNQQTTLLDNIFFFSYQCNKLYIKLYDHFLTI
jgi:hypothetical protein